MNSLSWQSDDDDDDGDDNDFVDFNEFWWLSFVIGILLVEVFIIFGCFNIEGLDFDKICNDFTLSLLLLLFNGELEENLILFNLFGDCSIGFGLKYL